MARPDKKSNGSTQQAQPEAERAPEQQTPQADGTAEVPPEAVAVDTPAMEAVHVEPGPEDFDAHTSARLIVDHARDLVLFDDVRRRLKNRAPVIAQRALDAAAKRGDRNPVVEIGGRRFFPRARPAKDGGGVGLSEERATRAVVALE
jgi:hypothetical protein